MTDLFHELRLSLRQLRRHPWVPLVVILSLALGIGANSAIFSITNAVFLRPLGGVEAPERLVAVYPPTSSGEPYGNTSYPRFREYRDSVRSLEAVAAYRDTTVTVTRDELATRVDAQLVSGDFFATLGVKPVAGRLLSSEDEGAPGGHPVAVLAHDLWRGAFGGDRSVIGSTIRVNGHSYQVIGVAEEGFRGTSLEHRTRLWIPLVMIEHALPAWGSKPLEMRGWAFFRMAGRLAPGSTLREAEHELDALAPRIEEWPVDESGRRVLVLPLQRASFAPDQRGAVVDYTALLLGVSGLLLLLTAVNVLNLLLYRVRNRDKERAIRLVLGAGRRRLVTRAILDPVVLAVVGGLAALGVAVLVGRIFTGLHLPIPLEIDPDLDVRVVLFTLALSLLVGLALGIVTAATAVGPKLDASLKGPGSAPAGRGRVGWSHAAVVFQIAFTLLFLVASGLLVRTLYNLSGTDLGFRGDSVVLATLDTTTRGFTKDETRTYLERVLQSVQDVPGVRRASLASAVPLGPQDMEFGLYTAADTGKEEPPTVTTKLVTPGYFEILEIPVLRGRAFLPQETTSEREVAVLNQSAAERLFGSSDPLGQRLGFNADGLDWEVVGVVADVHETSLREAPGPMVYFPYPTLAKLSGAPMTLVARVEGSAADIARTVVREIRPIDTMVGIYDVEVLAEKVSRSIVQERQITALLVAFALIALVLSAVGLSGVLSSYVNDRVREIGVRLALGAPRASLFGMILERSAFLLVLGVALGLALAFLGLRALAGLLYGVAWTSPALFGASLAFLFLVVFLVSVFPARRAVRLDPAQAIRHE